MQCYGVCYIMVVLPGAGEEHPAARRGGKSGQLKGRVAEETRPPAKQLAGRDRATETIKGETLRR